MIRVLILLTVLLGGCAELRGLQWGAKPQAEEATL